MNLPIQSQPILRNISIAILSNGISPSCPPGSWACTDKNTGACNCVACQNKTIFGTCLDSAATTCGNANMYVGGNC